MEMRTQRPENLEIAFLKRHVVKKKRPFGFLFAPLVLLYLQVFSVWAMRVVHFRYHVRLNGVTWHVVVLRSLPLLKYV